MSNFSMFGHVRTQHAQRRRQGRAQPRRQPRFVQRSSPTPTPPPELEPSSSSSHFAITRTERSLGQASSQSRLEVVNVDDSPLEAARGLLPGGAASLAQSHFGHAVPSASIIVPFSTLQEQEYQRAIVDSTETRNYHSSVSTTADCSLRQEKQLSFDVASTSSEHANVRSPPSTDHSSKHRRPFGPPVRPNASTRARDQTGPPVPDNCVLRSSKKPSSMATIISTQASPNGHLLERLPPFGDNPGFSSTKRAKSSQHRLRRPTSPLFEPRGVKSQHILHKSKRLGSVVDSNEEEAKEYGQSHRKTQQPKPNLVPDKPKLISTKPITKARIREMEISHPNSSPGNNIAPRSSREAHIKLPEKTRCRPDQRNGCQTVYSPIMLDSNLQEAFSLFREDSDKEMTSPPFSAINTPERDLSLESNEYMIRPTREHPSIPRSTKQIIRSGKSIYPQVPESEDEYIDDTDDLDDSDSNERCMRIRHRMMANLDAEVLPFSHSYYLLLRRALRGRDWRRSPVKYETQAEAGNPRYIFPLTIESITAKVEEKGRTNGESTKLVSAHTKLSGQLSHDLINKLEYTSDSQELTQDEVSNSPVHNKRHLRKRTKTLTTSQENNHTAEEPQKRVDREQKRAITLVVENASLKGKINQLTRELKSLCDHDSATSNFRASMSQEVVQLRIKICSLYEDLDQLRGENKRLEGENSGLNDQNIELNRKMEEMGCEIRESNDKVERLNSQLTATYHKSPSGQQDRDTPVSSISNLVAAENDLQLKYTELKAANEVLKRKYELLGREGDEMNKKCDNLKFTATEVLTSGNMMANENFGDLGLALLKLRELIR